MTPERLKELREICNAAQPFNSGTPEALAPLARLVPELIAEVERMWAPFRLAKELPEKLAEAKKNADVYRGAKEGMVSPSETASVAGHLVDCLEVLVQVNPFKTRGERHNELSALLDSTAPGQWLQDSDVAAMLKFAIISPSIISELLIEAGAYRDTIGKVSECGSCKKCPWCGVEAGGAHSDGCDAFTVKGKVK